MVEELNDRDLCGLCVADDGAQFIGFGIVGFDGSQEIASQQIMAYGPLDRGWILRFVNSGTKTRVIGFRNTVKANRSAYEKRVTRINHGDKARTGNRGSIAARNWFMQSAESALGNAAQTIADLIEIEAAAIARGEK